MAVVVVVRSPENTSVEVSGALRADGHRVHETSAGQVADAIRQHSPALVILVAPGGTTEPFEVCRDIRALSRSPILVLANSDDEVDELMAFAGGANEYVRSSSSIRLLRARVGALLRRYHPAPDGRIHVFGDLAVDPELRRVTVAEAELHLTRIEFELLLTLLENRHRVVPRSELIARIWGPWPGDDHVVEVHLSRMRTKILAAGGPRVGEPSPGYGYRLGSLVARAM